MLNTTAAFAFFAGMIAAQPAVPSPEYDGLKDGFERVNVGPGNSYLRSKFDGKLSCPGQAESEDILLIGPLAGRVDVLNAARVLPLPSRDASLLSFEQPLTWNQQGVSYELRQNGSHLLLKMENARNATVCYGAAALPKQSATAGTFPQHEPGRSEVLDALKADPHPFGNSGLKIDGEVFAGPSLGGSYPVFTRDFTGGPDKKYYSGPGLGIDLRLKWRPEEGGPWDAIKALDLSLSPSYTAAAGELGAGRLDFVTKLDVWLLQRVLGLEAGYQQSRNINHTDSLPLPPKIQEDALQRTWVGVLLTPFGPDAERGFELFSNIMKIPQYKDSEVKIGPNNWPARVRGAGPDMGWEAGLRLKYLISDDVKMPGIDWSIRDIKFFGETALMGGTPWDEPEGARLLLGLSAKLAPWLIARIGHRAQFNVDAPVLSDPQGRTRESSLSETFLQFAFPFTLFGGK